MKRQIKDSTIREVIVRKIENSLEDLGVSSAARTKEINNTSSAEETMEVRNRFFWKREKKKEM